MSASPQDIYNSITALAEAVSILSRSLRATVIPASSAVSDMATALNTLTTNIQTMGFVRWS